MSEPQTGRRTSGVLAACPATALLIAVIASLLGLHLWIGPTGSTGFHTNESTSTTSVDVSPSDRADTVRPVEVTAGHAGVCPAEADLFEDCLLASNPAPLLSSAPAQSPSPDAGPSPGLSHASDVAPLTAKLTPSLHQLSISRT